MVMVFRVHESVRTWGLLIFPMLACAPVDPPSEKAGQTTPIEKVAGAQAVRAPSWRWELLEEGQAITPDTSWSTRPFGTWFPVPDHVPHVEYVRVENTDTGARVGGYQSEHLPGEKRRWASEYPGEVAVGTMVQTDLAFPPVVVVAHHSPIASGTSLTAFNTSTGTRVWDVDLEGLGPVDHSKYRNRVQLEVRDERIVVYGWESQGRYIESRDPKSGALLSHDILDSGGPDAIPEGDERSTDRPGEDCKVVRALVNEPWRFELSFCPYSSGATLKAAKQNADEPAWSRRVRGLGSVAHSEYFSNYRLEPFAGTAMVIGWESAGSFLEIRDAETGEELWSIVKRD